MTGRLRRSCASVPSGLRTSSTSSSPAALEADGDADRCQVWDDLELCLWPAELRLIFAIRNKQERLSSSAEYTEICGRSRDQRYRDRHRVTRIDTPGEILNDLNTR